MTALVTERLQDLAVKLSDLKVRVRAAIASELGRTIGAAVRDVLVVTLTHRLAVPAVSTYSDGYRDEENRWGEPRPAGDSWDNEQDEIGHYRPASSRGNPDATPVIPAAAAVAVGVHIGRWWLSRYGGLIGAVAAGVLVATLGLASGPMARAALAVLAATADVMTGGSGLPAAPHDPD